MQLSRSAVWTQFATSSRRLSTDSVNNLETEHSGLTTWILINIDNFFNNGVIMSSPITNFDSSTAQKTVNWVTTADGCVHTADATQLDSWVASASPVCIGHKRVITTTIKLARSPETLAQVLQTSLASLSCTILCRNLQLAANHSVPYNRWYQPWTSRRSTYERSMYEWFSQFVNFGARLQVNFLSSLISVFFTGLLCQIIVEYSSIVCHEKFGCVLYLVAVFERFFNVLGEKTS